MIRTSAGLEARLSAARCDALAGERFNDLRMGGNILINVTIKFFLIRVYCKEAVESGVDPHRDTSDSDVRNFMTHAAAHLL
jgi:hypothetical protein